MPRPRRGRAAAGGPGPSQPLTGSSLLRLTGPYFDRVRFAPADLRAASSDSSSAIRPSIFDRSLRVATFIFLRADPTCFSTASPTTIPFFSTSMNAGFARILLETSVTISSPFDRSVRNRSSTISTPSDLARDPTLIIRWCCKKRERPPTTAGRREDEAIGIFRADRQPARLDSRAAARHRLRQGGDR